MSALDGLLITNYEKVKALFLEAAIARLRLWSSTGSVEELKTARANIDSILDLLEKKPDTKVDMRCM